MIKPKTTKIILFLVFIFILLIIPVLLFLISKNYSGISLKNTNKNISKLDDFSDLKKEQIKIGQYKTFDGNRATTYIVKIKNVKKNKNKVFATFEVKNKNNNVFDQEFLIFDQEKNSEFWAYYDDTKNTSHNLTKSKILNSSDFTELEISKYKGKLAEILISNDFISYSETPSMQESIRCNDLFIKKIILGNETKITCMPYIMLATIYEN